MPDLMRILDACKVFLQHEGWVFKQLDSKSALRFGIDLDLGMLICYLHAREQEEQLMFYAVAPISVPVAQRTLLAEFLTRVNYGLIIGNFEMDFADGEIRFKTSAHCKWMEIGDDFLRELVYTALRIVNRYLPGIHAVLAGISPMDAVKRVETEPSISPN